MMRYIRAFFKALQMTARGQAIAPPTYYLPLERWIDTGLQTLATVRTTAESDGITQEKRAAIQLKLDGHMTSLEQALQMVRHNFITEYPKLIQLDDPYTMMVVQSSNLNDQYRISQFAQSDDISSPTVKQALEELSQHLINLPQIERPEER